MKRSPKQVLEDHLKLRADGDLETDLRRNYDPRIVLLCANGVFHGLDAMRESAARLSEQLPNATFEYVRHQIDGDVGFMEWLAASDTNQVCDGADSYVFNEDGRIRAQTIHYTLRES